MSAVTPVEVLELRQICARSPRRRRMAAVCAQLGERASVRSVQRVTGGSHRDVGPVVKAWRRQQAAVAAMLPIADSSESLQMLGAIVLRAVDELREEQSRQAAAAQAELTTILRRLDAKFDVQRSQSGFAQQAAVDRQFHGLAARIETVVRKLDEAQVVTPADPSIHLARSMQRLQSEVTALTSTVAAWQPEGPALETLHQAVRTLEQRLITLGRSRAARSEPTLPPMLERRLETIEAALVQIGVQLKQQAARRRRGKTKKRSRAATRGDARKTVRQRSSEARRRPVARKTNVSSRVTDRSKRVSAKRPKATPQARHRASTAARRRLGRRVRPERARRKPDRPTSTARTSARLRRGRRRSRRYQKR